MATRSEIQGAFNQLERLRIAVTEGAPGVLDAASEAAIDAYALSELSGQSRHSMPRSALHLISERARANAERMAEEGPSVYYLMD